MRKSKQEAEKTRRRIVTSAAAEFRERGIVATGLNDLMQAAGLTHGGFYRHFDSKEQLVAEATDEAQAALIKRMKDAAGRGRTKSRSHGGLAAAVGEYLSIRHRDDPRDGCPWPLWAANWPALGRKRGRRQQPDFRSCWKYSPASSRVLSRTGRRSAPS